MYFQECNLHLHIGNTNEFFRIPVAVTSQYAPGLILAHGSVGKHLDLDIHVFISRDAGLTWTLVSSILSASETFSLQAHFYRFKQIIDFENNAVGKHPCLCQCMVKCYENLEVINFLSHNPNF